MIRRPPRSTQSRSSAASDVYKRQRTANFVLLPIGGKRCHLHPWSRHVHKRHSKNGLVESPPSLEVATRNLEPGDCTRHRTSPLATFDSRAFGTLRPEVGILSLRPRSPPAYCRGAT